MADIIFTKATVLKQDLYTFIKNLLTTAGWQNISSNKPTDFDEFYSNGNNGLMNLYFQMKEIDYNTGVPFSTNTSSMEFQFRMSGKYIPGTAGVAGVFQRPTELWRRALIQGASPVPLNTPFTVYYHVDKNRLIFAADLPLPFGAMPSLVYIGMPNEVYIDEHDCSGLVFVASNYCDAYNQCREGQVVIYDNAYVSVSASYNFPLYSNTQLQFKNTANKRFMSEILYGNSIEGMRGKLDGIYEISQDSAVANDILVDANGYRYQVLFAGSYNYPSISSGYPTNYQPGFYNPTTGVCKYVAIRIS